MADDWYIEAGKVRLQEIAAERSQALADLEAAKRDDPYGAGAAAGEAVQRIADLDAAYANMMNLYQRYWQSQNPPAPPEPSLEERAAKPLSRMDYGDVYEMLKHSKYGVDDDAFRAGIAEVQRRRARGE